MVRLLAAMVNVTTLLAQCGPALSFNRVLRR
jgi:hypothetical protein